jgi:small subunit ribosomal protein S8
MSLKYIGKRETLLFVKLNVKPGLRVYSNSKELPRVLDDLGIAIISTSKE